MPTTNPERIIHPTRQELRTRLTGMVQQVADHEPENLFWPMARWIFRTQQQLAKPSTPAEIHQLQPAIELAKRVIRLTSSAHGSYDAPTFVDHVIHDYSIQYAKAEKSPHPEKEYVISLAELIQQYPENFRFNDDQTKFLITHPTHPESQFGVVIPPENTIWYKGGAARVIAKIVCGSPTEMIQNELPFNDFDAVAIGDLARAKQYAKIMGVDDEAGLEMVEGDTIDFTPYCNGRDLTMNQCFFGKDGIHFSESFLNDCQQGYARIVGLRPPQRAIYGFDVWQHKGTPIVKSRGVARLLKTVTEGKALGFHYRDVQQQFDIGIHPLLLARRWHHKKNFPELLQKMFHLLQKMNQTQPEDKNIFDLLTRIHQDNPFFVFDDKNDLLLWKTVKLAKQIDSQFGWDNPHLNPDRIIRTPGDETKRFIDLSDFSLDPTLALETATRWQYFLKECHQRNHDFITHHPPSLKVFG